MSEENKQENTLNGANPKQGTLNSGSFDQDSGSTLTQDQVNKIVADRVTRAERSTEQKIFDTAKVKSLDELTALITAGREAETAKLTEAEKTSKQITDLTENLNKVQGEKGSLEEQVKQLGLDLLNERRGNKINAALEKAGANDPEIASDTLFKMNKDATFLTAEGVADEKAITEAVDKLKKEKAFLFKTTNYKGTPSSSSGTPPAPDEQRRQEARQRLDAAINKRG